MKPEHPRARGAIPDPPVREAPSGAPEYGTAVENDGELTLADILWTIVENWRLVAATMVTVLLSAGAYVTLTNPVFHTNALLQVEDRGKTLPGLDDVQSMFTEKSFADTEIEIIRSRSLIGAVVDELNLTVVAAPRRFPIFGGAVARRHRADEIARPFLGLARYAWGGERVVVTRLEVPDHLLNLELALVAGEGDRFELLDPDGALLVAGEVGTAATATHGKASLTVFVQELRGRPGTHFRLTKRRRADVVATLQQGIVVAEKAKKTGIITLALDGNNPWQITGVLNSIAQNYVRQNVERRSAEAAKTLEFLEEQLPILKANLDGAEAALSAFRLKHGSVDLSRETQAMLERTAEIEKSRFELELSRSELLQRFTGTHPTLRSVDDKMSKLRAERATLETQLRALPEKEITTLRLMRDAKVASELYLMLLNKSEELRIVKSGTVGNVRILDTALEPVSPSRPRKRIVLGFALLVGIGLGIGLAFAKNAIDQGLKDPEEIEAKTGLPVYASVPHSEREDEFARERTDGGQFRVLALVDPTDLAIESLRSLRTSLQFALVEARNNIVAIGGPSPGVGKTFLSVNLGHVLANAGKRVLLVDADLRKGKLHRFFGGQRGPGLSEVVAGQASLQDVVRRSAANAVEVVTTGKLPPNPSELLGTKGFQAFLDEASARYDFVIVDAPPVLAVTDAAIVAALAGVNLLVLRAGRHPSREILAALKALGHAGARASGAVVNDVRTSMTSRYGRYAYGYHYHYDYRAEREDEA